MHMDQNGTKRLEYFPMTNSWIRYTN